ncbi:MAG: phosphatidate cytidylyltransferase [Alphaproteobacteria bacterium]|nr:phosphatidate cytidylyltransferase [Alphaproteobacteria bacterium]
MASFALSPELRSRVVSGAVMAAFGGVCVYFGGIVFAGVTAVLTVIAALEAMAMFGVNSRPLAVVLSVVAAIPALSALHPTLSVEAVLPGVVVALFVAVLLLRLAPWRAALAASYIAIAAAALVWLREGPDGLAFVSGLVVIVVATDICAYFFGRAIGGPKLAPKISPNKTISGALGGVFGASGLCLVFLLALFPGLVEDRLLSVILLAVVLSAVAQCGDLLESSAKRRQGVKDSGDLIPGHGGILDRVDGFLAAAPTAALMVMAFGTSGLW